LVNALYRLSHIRQVYDGRVVLDIEALEVYPGEVLALVGPSGAGKSTLLRLLNFVEPPTSGLIEFDGRPMPADPPLAALRRVTTVFQRPLKLAGTVRDNVAYGLRLRRAKRPLDGRVDAMLARVGLAHLAGSSAGRLSGGEMQRTALARALVVEPDVLLLDEPTANLDPNNVGQIETILREQNLARGTTLVLVTHNVFQARRLANRVGLLLAGRLIEVAQTETFFSHPSDPRTAAFVRGDMIY
jgi:tungstate transport system ATP-binding protein